MTIDRAKTARELLAFYLEAGVDALVTEEPVDRFADHGAQITPARLVVRDAGPSLSLGRAERGAEGRAPHHEAWRASTGQLLGSDAPTAGGRPEGRTASRPPSAPAPPSPEAAVMAAREAARRAASLEELRAILERFEGCTLKTTAKQLVFADGNPQARVMFVGEAPGRDEDLEGRPFVGRSGHLLDRMMKAICLDRTKAYIANIVPWRPPGNRTPTPQETQICLPFIRRQIELADPDVLVCLGSPSMQALLGVNDGIMKMRGRWMSFDTGSRVIRAMATLHPAYLLRQPLAKRLAWRDFRAIKQALAERDEARRERRDDRP